MFVLQEEMGAGGGNYGGGYVGGAGGPMRNGKQPDWTCPEPNCQNRNFGWREVCNRCQVRKSLAFELILHSFLSGFPLPTCGAWGVLSVSCMFAWL